MPMPMRRQMSKRKSTLRMIPVNRDRSDSASASNSENTLKERMEGTGKRLADMMSAFSNVGNAFSTFWAPVINVSPPLLLRRTLHPVSCGHRLLMQ